MARTVPSISAIRSSIRSTLACSSALYVVAGFALGFDASS
jgi:hypothetical protein